MMDRLYLKPSLCKAIAEYCEANSIDDVNAFANRCATQGFNIAKYGLSPGDNIERENNGIKDFKKNEHRRKTETRRESTQAEDEKKEDDSARKEEIESTDEKSKDNVTVRKIQIIKKR